MDEGPTAATFGAVCDKVAAYALLALCALTPTVFLSTVDGFASPKRVTLVACAVLAVAAFGARVWSVGVGAIRPGIVDVLLGAFVLANLAAFVWSVDRDLSLWGEPYQYQGVLTTLIYVALYFVARFTLRGFARLGWLASTVAITGGVVAAYGLAQALGIDPFWSSRPDDRIFSSLGQPNALAAYLVVALPLSIERALAARSWARAGYVAAAAASLWAVALTLSRGGYLGVAVSLLVLLAGLALGTVRSGGIRLRRVMAVTIVVVTLGVAVLVGPLRATSISVGNRAAATFDLEDMSTWMRLDLWRVGWHVAVDNPLVGTGQDTYALLFPLYRDRVLAPSHARAFFPFRPESPHNVYLAWAAGAGFPAALAYTAFLILTIAGIARFAARASQERSLLLAVLAAIVGHAVTYGFMTADIAISATSWILMGAAWGTVQHLTVRESSAAEPETKTPGASG